MRECKIGVVFDEEDSAKLGELLQYYETDAYNILASAIDFMYKFMKKETESDV